MSDFVRCDQQAVSAMERVTLGNDRLLVRHPLTRVAHAATVVLALQPSHVAGASPAARENVLAALSMICSSNRLGAIARPSASQGSLIQLPHAAASAPAHETERASSIMMRVGLTGQHKTRRTAREQHSGCAEDLSACCRHAPWASAHRRRLDRCHRDKSDYRLLQHATVTQEG